ncbi:hypothetical protein EDD15DRAFT_2365971 [Pisolithus albus]|nr:hypothetical protein EDD15DRAFT_2365971 [Pisolithus albus]
MDTIQSDIAKLPVSAIISHLAGTVTLSNEERSKKTLLLQRIMQDACPTMLQSLQRAGVEHERRKFERRANKRTREAEPDIPRKAPRTGKDHEDVRRGDVSSESTTTFLELPTPEEEERIYSAFYLATGSEALRSATCGVCARECSIRDDGIRQIKLTDIPNAGRLWPKNPHPKHRLVNDMLLEPTAITEEGGSAYVDICGQCLGELRKSRNAPPWLSLAN